MPSDIQESNEDLEIIDNQKKPVGKFNKQAFGSSGTMIFGEIFDEEFLAKLSGFQRADIWDEIVRTDDTVTMLLTARKNPILQGEWSFEEPDFPTIGLSNEQIRIQEEQGKKITAHCQHEFFERMEKDFKDILEEQLSFIENGWSGLERIHEVVKDPLFGTYVGYKNLAYRSQRTIERWVLNKSGKIESVFQQADGDLEAHAHIPGDFFTVFSLRKKGDNYEGISALRPIYGNWQRKCLFLKLLAIGIERYAINTPVGKVPAGKESSKERKVFVEMLKKISSHQQNYMTLPEGWDVEFLKNPFDVDKVIKAIAREDEGMVRSFVANHLNLGVGGGGGSYALGTDFSDQFLSIIEGDADIFARRFNKEIIREFVDFNYGKQSVYPKLKVTGINDKFGKELSDIIKSMIDGKAITPTENLEIALRKRLGLPDLLEEDKVQIDPVRQPEKPALFSEQKTSIQLADLAKVKSKVNSQLSKSGEALSLGMQQELDKRAQALIDNTINRMKAVKPSEWRKILRTSEGMKASQDYKLKVKNALAETASRAITQARNEVPGGRRIQFCEGLKSRVSLKLAEDNFKNLPKKTRELILTDTQLVVDSQFTGIGNALILTANGAVDETQDIEVIKKRLQEEKSRRIEGQGKTGINGAIITAGANLTSKAYNTARVEFFQSPESLDKIEAFQFQNTDPTSPICQDLNGRIFPKDDPESARFLPPLHHNCKSFIVPVFDLRGKTVSEFGLKPSSPKLEKFITL